MDDFDILSGRLLGSPKNKSSDDFERLVKKIYSEEESSKKKGRTPVPISIIKQLLINCKGCCQKCKKGLNSKPDIHHIDHDNTNSKDINNLMVVCANCHRVLTYNDDGTVKKPKTQKSPNTKLESKSLLQEAEEESRSLYKGI